MSKTRKHKPSIQHHHLLLRMELETCPEKKDKREVTDIMESMLNDLNMKALSKPHIYYVTTPHCNEGLTAIIPIQTSHLAFHFWKYPDADILHNDRSRCLLELDIYTCGALSMKHVQDVVAHLTPYRPTHADLHLFNRKTSLQTVKQLQWNGKVPWKEWVSSLKN